MIDKMHTLQGEIRTAKWDRRFLALADHIAQWSKDPSTKVGAVVVDHKQRAKGMGYNGFPRGVSDKESLYLPDEDGSKTNKYMRVVHAELNAILEAGNCEGMTIYTSMFSCNECAKAIIQAGITRVVSPEPTAAHWADSHAVAYEMYMQAGVKITYVRPA